MLGVRASSRPASAAAAARPPAGRAPRVQCSRLMGMTRRQLSAAHPWQGKALCWVRKRANFCAYAFLGHCTIMSLRCMLHFATNHALHNQPCIAHPCIVQCALAALVICTYSMAWNSNRHASLPTAFLISPCSLLGTPMLSCVAVTQRRGPIRARCSSRGCGETGSSAGASRHGCGGR